MTRILLVTHYFPPETGAPQARLSEMAREWAASGADVTVLTSMPNHPTGVIPEDYRGAVWRQEQRAGCRVLRTWLYATPNGGMAVLLVVEGVPVEAALAPLALYLADTGSTLLRRFRAGEQWHLPHRTHAYQRLTDHGLTHVQVSGLVLVLLVVCSGLGSLSLQGGSARLLGDVAVVVVLGAYLSLPGFVARRRSLA